MATIIENYGGYDISFLGWHRQHGQLVASADPLGFSLGFPELAELFSRPTTIERALSYLKRRIDENDLANHRLAENRKAV